MSTTPTVPAPPIDINSPAVDIAAANAQSQQTPTPGQPRNPDGTFATPAPPPPTPAPPQPYSVVEEGGKVKIKFADLPEVYEGANQQEALAKVAEALYNTKKYAQTLKAQPVQQPPAPPQQPVVTQSPFADPAEAATANYVLDLVAKSMNLPNGDALKEQMGFVTANTTDYASQTTALQFQAMQPDFNPTPENSDKLLQVLNDSGVGQVFDSAPREQQVRMLQQAHAYCLMAKIYDPKPATTQAPNVPTPPPPAPGGRTAMPEGQLPDNLRATLNDTPEQIKAKWDEARRLGYA